MEVLGGSFNEIWAMSPQVSSYMATHATLRMSTHFCSGHAIRAKTFKPDLGVLET